MATSDLPVFEVKPNPPPRPFAVAAWLGMTQEDIVTGLKDGSIVPPPGAPPNWVPLGFSTPLESNIGLGAALESRSDGHTSTGGTANSAGDEFSAGGSLVERARVRGWFRALDTSLDDTAFELIWKRAGDSDAVRAASLTGFLARTLLGIAMPEADSLDERTPKTIAEVAKALSEYTADASHRAKIVDLSNMEGGELARRAQTDIGYRYALTQFDSVALTGNRALFAAANADGRLDRFDPDTGENNLSGAWLSDRGKFLAWKIASNFGASLAIGGDHAWTFIDRAKVDSNGQPLTLKLTPGSRDAQQDQVIFGAESAEIFKGGAGTDRIYGGGGDDLLRGAAGADHLEGGLGDDVTSGGSGSDELFGNQGSDELVGGKGTDSLDGGSGDDMLTGGRGDDQLAGGDGADTYMIEAGDGTDTIIDSDGQGAIELDDEVITGASQKQDGVWTSGDGRLDYTIEGEPSGESSLTIRAFAADADHAGDPDNVIEVRHWHNGDLGITLDDSALINSSPDHQDSDPSSAPPEITAVDIPFNGMAAHATGAQAGNGAAESGGQAPPTDAPVVEESSVLRASDFNDAISRLLAVPNADVASLNSNQFQQAVTAFSGVLAPPDVSFGGPAGGDYGSNAVSIADITGALADYGGGHDMSGESASGLVPLAPDLHSIESIVDRLDGSTRHSRFGKLGVQP
jgi:hypothetical protein